MKFRRIGDEGAASASGKRPPIRRHDHRQAVYFRNRRLLARLKAGFALAEERLSGFDRVEFIQRDGAFYRFFRVSGLTDSAGAASGILESTGVGLAPGVTLGPAGEGYLRLCCARPPELLDEAFDRLAPILGG